jgi:hypothetical protein
MFETYTSSNMLVTVLRKYHRALAIAGMEMEQWQWDTDLKCKGLNF